MLMNKIKNAFVATLIVLMTIMVSTVYADEEKVDVSVKPLDGDLILPDDYNKAEEKKCMTVCERWGEDCIINPRTGSRNCRRVCKSFAEECF